MNRALPAHLERDGSWHVWSPFPAGRISHGSRTEPPDRGPCLGFPSRPPSAGTCEPDCWEAGGESFLEKELSAGAAPRETGGGGGASGLPRQARFRLGELGRSSCAAGEEKQVQERYLLRCGSGSQGEPETQPLPAK